MKNRITRLQALAIGQLALVGLETVLGILAITAFPNEGGNGIFNTLVAMLLFAFAIPAVMTFMSAGKLALPKERSSEQAWKSAFATQKGLFVLCIVLLIPSISLALNGFVFFAINCVLGIVLWPFVNKERKKHFPNREDATAE
jgi:heme A synthase